MLASSAAQALSNRRRYTIGDYVLDAQVSPFDMAAVVLTVIGSWLRGLQQVRNLQNEVGDHHSAPLSMLSLHIMLVMRE